MWRMRRRTLISLVNNNLPDFSFSRFDFEENFIEPVEFGTLKIGQLLEQFDLSKNFNSYQREVEAYVHLKEAWGELVPTPKFIAESPSGMVRFLGLQKGRSPKEGEFDEQFSKVIGQVHTEYNFQPVDYSHGRNCITVPGNNGQEKWLIIGLEFWEHFEKVGAE
jgi:hypothetical protein